MSTQPRHVGFAPRERPLAPWGMPNRARPLQEAAPAEHAGALSTEAIVAAAVELADAEGLPAVSIRRLARVLRARPMSLYTYVAAKDDLLTLMSDRVLEEVVVPELPEDWRPALSQIARRLHQTLISHPWVLELPGHRRDLGGGALAHAEQLLTAVQPLGVDASTTWQVVFIVSDYTLGHALRVTHAAREPELAYPGFTAEQYPRLAAAGAATSRGVETFEHGLAAVLDGIAQRYG